MHGRIEKNRIRFKNMLKLERAFLCERPFFAGFRAFFYDKIHDKIHDKKWIKKTKIAFVHDKFMTKKQALKPLILLENH